MSRLALWIVSWAASAVLLSPLWGASPPAHMLAAVNVYAWFICTLGVLGFIAVFTKDGKAAGQKSEHERNPVDRAVGKVTSLVFIGALAYTGWVGMFGTLLVCWLWVTAVTSPKDA